LSDDCIFVGSYHRVRFGIAAFGQVATLPFVDTSDSGSPLHKTGTMTYWEAVESSPRCADVIHEPRCVVGEHNKQLTIKNVSDAPILAFLVSGVVSTPAAVGEEFTHSPIPAAAGGGIG
jgi:hypothetical protein